MPSTSHLIPITRKGDSEDWVDARTLHRALEVGKDFSNWIKDYITDFAFIEGRDFSPNLAKSTGGRQAIEYTITLDMAKHLAMMQRNEKGMQARQYFIEYEKRGKRLEAALISGYDKVQGLLNECYTIEHNNYTWYAAAQLRRLSGKSTGAGFKYKINALQLQDKVIKMPYRGVQAWFVRFDAVQDILCIRPNQMVAAAMVNLLQKGGSV